ncbi:MAG TPA: C40 family peptidase [Jatrophihabitantaceae bacterium]
MSPVGRTRTAVLGLLLTGACLLAVPAAVSATPGSPTPTPTPTPVLIPPALSPILGAQVQEAKDAADKHVSDVNASVKQQAKAVADASAAAGLAEQEYTAQLAVQNQAKANEAAARARVTTAQDDYRNAYAAFAASAVSAYESDSAPDSLGSSPLGSLLVVDDPTAVLDATAEHQMLADHQANMVTRMAMAKDEMQQAEKQQAAALADIKTQTAQLARIRAAAASALDTAQTAMQQLQSKLADAKKTRKQADAALDTFLGGWSAAEPGRAGQLNEQYERIALKVRNDPPAPAGTHWTAAMGRTVVDRALQYLGTPYAWAGGSMTGPTPGQCVSGAARNDCHLIGFDCSGLALYSWAPYRALAHSAEVQYSSGSVHPDPSALLPGDLVFWRSNHAVSGIHHVAIYVGNGNVIQAPESGDIVRITPLQSVSRGYFGATRPMS